MRRTTLAAVLAFCCLALIVPCDSNPLPLPQSVEVNSSQKRLTADSPIVTPGGATFMAPSGWSIVTRRNLVILEPPEADTHIAIVDSLAGEANQSVAAGWAAYKPNAKRPLKLGTPRPARDAWAQLHV